MQKLKLQHTGAYLSNNMMWGKNPHTNNMYVVEAVEITFLI
jgi:hypothetical protein